MKMTVSFINTSALPLACIKTFGVSAKENEHPIGYFGTGLKYAIAVMCREGCEVSLSINSDSYKFTKRVEQIRNKEFEFIYMNEEQLPFTTELGKNWQLWHAYRELYSNCMDETGQVTTDTFYENDLGTSFDINGLDEIHKNRHTFILLSIPKHTIGDIEIHESKEPAIFYKGIKVLELQTKYSYNILSDLELTEDRTARQWDVEYAITGALTTCNNIDAITDVLSIDEETGFYEAKLNYSKYVTPSHTFMKLVSILKKRTHNAEVYYGHWEPNFAAALPRESLSKAIRLKLNNLKKLFSFAPKEIYVMKLDEDFKIIKDELCLNLDLMKSQKHLTFVYMLSCHMMQGKNKGRDKYRVIVEEMLPYFNIPKTVKDKAA